jgi:nickel-dependent lactate racemase
MGQYLNYEGGRIQFDLPPGWNLISQQDIAAPDAVSDIKAEIDRALENPIGSARIEDLVRPGMDVVLLFDDQQRPTPASIALPLIMNRLNAAGVRDERTTAICACGTHPGPDEDQMKVKVGEEVLSRLSGRVFTHDSKSPENIIIGRTRRGNLVEISRHVALADLIIGVGECMPHPTAGYGGGYKIVMPGVSSYRSIAEHHFAFMRNRSSRVNLLDGNPFWEEIVDAGRMSRLTFKLDFIMNEKKQVIRAFAGDPEAEWREAARFAESLYLMRLPRHADVTITSASPLELGVQATKALLLANCCTRSGGTIVWVASQKHAGPILPLIEEMGSRRNANEIHRDFVGGAIPKHLSRFGISYIMQIVHYKELVERFNIIHVTEGLTPEQVRMMGMTYANDLQQTIDDLAKDMPRADVAVFPSGGNIIPEVR